MSGWGWVSLPEPVPLEHLVDLLHMQPFALRQQQVDEDGAQGAASSKEEEDPVGSMICCQSDPAELFEYANEGQVHKALLARECFSKPASILHFQLLESAADHQYPGLSGACGK